MAIRQMCGTRAALAAGEQAGKGAPLALDAKQLWQQLRQTGALVGVGVM